MKQATLFQCPVCAQVLYEDQRRYFCSQGHNFDVAKQGYVNLLLPHHIGSGNPGDSPEMLQKRRRFLSQGYYQPFSDEVNALVSKVVAANTDTPAILDAGCGEGYYTWRLWDKLKDRDPDIYGIDVSKKAVQYAAKKSREIRFAVGTNYRLPFLRSSMDCILSLFAPRDEEEFAAVLKPQGALIVAAPGENHLLSLRQVLYDQPAPIGERGTVKDSFTLEEHRQVTFEIQLQNNEDLLNLLTMTPYSRHASPEALEKLQSLDQFTTQVDINLRLYRRN